MAGLAAGLGAWILWSGVVLTGTGMIVAANFLAGAAIAIFASYAAAKPDGGRLPSVVAPVITALIGVGVIAAAFVFEVETARVLWSNVISGALVAVLAIGSVVGLQRSTGSTATSA